MRDGRPIVFITGATSGIGRAIAEALAQKQYRLATTFYKDIEQAKQLERACKESGAGDFFCVELDLTDRQSILEATRATINHYGKIDILINNAGLAIDKPFSEQTEAEILVQINTNLTGTVFLTKSLLPHIESMIINIGSSASKRGRMGHAVYSATKFAIRGFTQALAQESLYLKVFCVNPDRTATAITNFEGRPPIEVANTVLALIEQPDSYLSGSEINLWELDQS